MEWISHDVGPNAMQWVSSVESFVLVELVESVSTLQKPVVFFVPSSVARLNEVMPLSTNNLQTSAS